MDPKCTLETPTPVRSVSVLFLSLRFSTMKAIRISHRLWIHYFMLFAAGWAEAWTYLCTNMLDLGWEYLVWIGFSHCSRGVCRWQAPSASLMSVSGIPWYIWNSTRHTSRHPKLFLTSEFTPESINGEDRYSQTVGKNTWQQWLQIHLDLVLF